MIEPFCSVYTKFYRAHEREPEVESVKPCLYHKDLGENFLPEEDSKAIYNPERDEAVIKDLQLKRLISTYQESYCSSVGTKSLVIDPNNLDEDQFMVYFNDYYAKKTGAVPRPLETGRRINGYSRFDHYYTGKSMYEETISREGYNFFKKGYDEGKSRLFRKKQQEMQKQKKEEDLPQDKEVSALSMAKTEESKKEKICMICCEKFGDFSCFPEKSSETEK